MSQKKKHCHSKNEALKNIKESVDQSKTEMYQKNAPIS